MKSNKLKFYRNVNSKISIKNLITYYAALLSSLRDHYIEIIKESKNNAKFEFSLGTEQKTTVILVEMQDFNNLILGAENFTSIVYCSK